MFRTRTFFLQAFIVGLGLLAGPLTNSCSALDLVTVTNSTSPADGWTFDRGAEFPGATGDATVDEAVRYNGKPSLKLSGDFSKGGAYVQIIKHLDKVNLQDLTLWLKNPAKDTVTIRLNDASGQTHQFRLKVEKSDDWQRVALSVKDFFDKSNPAGVANVQRYEFWGGAKDGKWHGPAAMLAIIIDKPAEGGVRNLWVGQITATAAPVEAPGPRMTSVVRLDNFEEGEHDWRTWADNKVAESAKVNNEAPKADGSSLKVTADFTAGGAYAAIDKNLGELDLGDVDAVRFQAKSTNVDKFTARFTDGTGQTHQKKGIPFTADGQWHDVVIRPREIAGGEHWGGANDGQWHGEPTSFALIVTPGADENGKVREWLLSDIRADAVVKAVAQAPSFQANFEGQPILPPTWTTAGDVKIDDTLAFKGKNSLLLTRPLADINRPISVQSPSFEVTPGQWQIALALKSDLKSADASYSGTVDLEFLDNAGKSMDKVNLADVFGQSAWQPIAKQVEVPRGAKSARLRVQINKAEGQFRVDEISASFLAPAARKDLRVTRLAFNASVPGNLLLPTDPRVIKATVLSSKPLKEEQRKITWKVRDYWGAEQNAPVVTPLEKLDKKGANFAYEASLDLSKVDLQVGRYYEIHGDVPEINAPAYHDFNSFAILPEAAANKFKPEEIPFTSRSWDNRIPATIELSNRLGIRVAGIWGGWSSQAPYSPNAPALDVVKKLGMGWLTGTPAHSIEMGEDKYNEESLRQGMQNFLKQFGDYRPLYINLGNEPHGAGPQIQKNVEAYRVLYEEIKKFDPNITVVATSVEPNEEYFKAGYGKYCDAYDFHVYETAEDIRHAMARYQELMKQYGVVHPIWSTEVGLNSQGLPRQMVAGEVYKKFAAFFAQGGVDVSWFGMLYPDTEGKLYGSSGEAHNVFYTRYNNYAPKLDAIAYYYAVNNILNKKFVAERQYPDGTSAFLFRDSENHCLQILYRKQGRGDIGVSLPGVTDLAVTRIDGSISRLNAAGKSITLGLEQDPILLSYTGGPKTLPDALAPPALALQSPPALAVRGGTTNLTVALNGSPAADANLQVPPFWSVKKETATAADGKPAVRFAVTAPEESDARMADMLVTLGPPDNRRAELNYRPQVSGQISMDVLPVAAQGGKPAAVRLNLTNNATTPQDVTWELSLLRERVMDKGDFGPPSASTAYFAEAPTGSVKLNAGETKTVTVALAEIQERKLYQLRAVVTEASGRSLTCERMIGGLALVPRAGTPLKLDGSLDEADWAKAPVQHIDDASQMFAISKDAAPWRGPEDLSAKVRYLWDDKYLYVGVEVTDDIAGALQDDGALWNQDGLQFLIDPTRTSDEKAGKYDYSVGIGKNGPRAWSHLSANPALPGGLASDIIVGAKRGTGGNLTYEIAFPWARLVPFQPKAGGDLGLSLALNEDDGKGRFGFMTWFGNVQTKDAGIVGDLILGE